MATRSTQNRNTTAANVGYEAELWQMADALRGSMDAAEYKHVIHGRHLRRPFVLPGERQSAEIQGDFKVVTDVGPGRGALVSSSFPDAPLLSPHFE